MGIGDIDLDGDGVPLSAEVHDLVDRLKARLDARLPGHLDFEEARRIAALAFAAGRTIERARADGTVTVAEGLEIARALRALGVEIADDLRD